MNHTENIKFNLPEDLKKCIEFHGHLCPGLVYGYLVAREAITLLKLKRSKDEEVVAISENDSCAVDALQMAKRIFSRKCFPICRVIRIPDVDEILCIVYYFSCNSL
jgi:formylmethanofuran dehydrogenase subunit E